MAVDLARPFAHVPVLLGPVVDLLQPRAGGRYLDGTLGGGGHSQALLKASAPDGRVVGIDRDPQALAAATERLRAYGDRFLGLHGCFGDMEALAGGHGPFDGILLDLGVSSPQLDQAERGFSLQADAFPDMRMSSEGETASALLDRLDEASLVDILVRYGDEPRARRIARAILAGRPWTSTVELAACVARASGYRNSRVHPATRTFQALRVAVNDEEGELQRGLDAAERLLAPGGRLAVISFQSHEDRVVKHRFRELAGIDGPKDPYGQPVQVPAWELVTRKGIAGKDADTDNPRARSARLRVIARR